MIFRVNLQPQLSGNEPQRSDQYWMHQALKLAKHAERQDEVPVGAIVMLDNEIIGEGWNQSISQHDPTAHAEVIALRAAAKKVKNYRLVNANLYVTLEPCAMCAGAIVHARIKQLHYGVKDPKAGVIESQSHFLDQHYLNHRVKYTCNILADECSNILRQFFLKKRNK